MINYKIADLVTRLNLANQYNKNSIYIKFKLNSSSSLPILSADLNQILNVLNDECPNTFQYHFIYPNKIKIILNKPFTSLSVISKPSRRKYVQNKNLRTLNRGLGFYIIRTCKGIMSSSSALKLNLGGELLIKCV